MLKNIFNLFINFNKKKDKEEIILYPYCIVAYKLTDLPGWNLAIFDGDKEYVTEKCKKYNWYEYVVFNSGNNIYPIKDSLEYYPPPDEVHLLTDWIYWYDIDGWFIKEDEIIPYPFDDCEITDKIQFSYDFYGEFCDNTVDVYNNVEDIYVTAEIAFETKTQKVESLVQVDLLCKEFERFIDDLKTKKFAVCQILEFSNHKLFAWEKDEKIRFMIQDYNPKDIEEEVEYVPTVFDVLVNKDIFLKYFTQFYSSLKENSEKLLEEMVASKS